MATLTAEKQTFEAYPTGEYLCQLTDYEEDEGNFGPQFRFRFEIVKPADYAGKSITVWCSRKLSSGKKSSKLWRLVESLYNRALQVGEDVDLDEVVGRQAILVIVTETAEDGGEYNKVTGFKPYKKQPAFEAGSFQTGEPEADDDPFDNE